MNDESWRAKMQLLLFRKLVFYASDGLAFQAHFDHGVQQISSGRVLKRGAQKGPLQDRDHVRNDNDEAGVQIDSTEKLDEIGTVIGHEREFVFDDPLSRYPVGLAAQAKVIDVRCVDAKSVGQPHEGLMQTLVFSGPRTTDTNGLCASQKSHGTWSRELSGKDFNPRGFLPCQGRRAGRPRRGKARM